MGIELILFMGLLLVGLFVMNTFAKKNQTKREAERARLLNEEMVPGAWVQTFSGFFGRYIDRDGDVIILETPSGEETYWVKAAVRSIGEPPFEAVLDEDDSTPELDLEEEDLDLVEEIDVIESDSSDDSLDSSDGFTNEDGKKE